MLLTLAEQSGYWASVLPLLACLVMGTRGRDPIPDVWILSVGLAVSFFVDTVAADLAARGLSTWGLTYLLAPIQYGVLLLAVTRHRPVFVLFLVALVALAVASTARGPLTAPETVVEVVGGLVVGWLALGREDLPHRRALWTYCLGLAPLLILLAAVPRDRPAWLSIWVAYQAVRVLALVWLTGGILQGATNGRTNDRHFMGERRSRRRPPGVPPDYRATAAEDAHAGGAHHVA
jgi:glucan phosphoethanolaminetransferase (alkaline phosphatase superfamily)